MVARVNSLLDLSMEADSECLRVLALLEICASSGG
jgi:hypothetical protein